MGTSDDPLRDMDWDWCREPQESRVSLSEAITRLSAFPTASRAPERLEMPSEPDWMDGDGDEAWAGMILAVASTVFVILGILWLLRVVFG